MTGADVDHNLTFTIGRTETTPYACQFCDKAFPRLSFLKKHEQTHSDQMPFKCNYCQRLFKHKRSRDRHIKLHTGDKKYRCGQCEAAFCRSDHLKIHMKTHDNAKPFQCTVCNRGYNTAAALTAHAQNHKRNMGQGTKSSSFVNGAISNQQGSFRCLQCTAIFTTAIELQSHALTHQIRAATNPSHYSPSGVPIQSMESQTSPGQNQLMTKDNRMLQCLYCGQLCFGMDNLMQHIEQSHTGSGENPSMVERSDFRCPICAEIFMSMELLNKHVKNHEDQLLNGVMDVDFQKSRITPSKHFCSYCPKGVRSFMSFEALQLHIQITHGSYLNSSQSAQRCGSLYGNLPELQQGSAFSCEFCTLKFSSVQALQKHTLAAHSFKDIDTNQSAKSPVSNSGDTYCSQCKKSFSDNNSLLDHIKSVHETTNGERSTINGIELHPSSSPLSNDTNRTSVSPKSPSTNSAIGASTDKTFLCSQCNASFSDFESFRTHLKTHIDQSMRQQMFICPECKVEFSTEEQLDNHVTNHYLSTSTEYGCQCCMKLFSKPDELQKHLMDIHAHHLYRCSLCRQVFDSKVGVQVHFAVKHSDECKLFKCKLCNSFFRSEMEFHLHVKISHLHKAQPYRCLFCHLSFPSELDLQYHLTTHKKQFSCKLCDEEFHVEFLLDKHMHSKHSQKYVPQAQHKEGSSETRTEVPEDKSDDKKESKCVICDVTFQSNAQLIAHRLQFHGSARSNSSNHSLSLHCAYCSESCKSRTELENHMKSHTATTSGKHKCNVCDELCPSATILAEHKLQHCKILTSSLCVTCKCTIRNEQQFYSHIQQHNGHGFPTPCVICRQTLTTEVEIQVHSKFHLKHSINQLKSCDHCKAEFEMSQIVCEAITDNNENLSFVCKDCYEIKKQVQANEINAANNSDLKCYDCNVKFESVGELEIHKLTHKKTYQCIKCQLSFETESEIQKHVTTHLMTEGSNHECRLCSNVFVSPAKLQCHLIEHTFEGCANFTCYMCSSVFTSSHAIQQHMLEHGLASRPYDCHQCNLKFFFRAELENHSFVHQSLLEPRNSVIDSENNPDLKCVECSKTFSSTNHLMNHMKTHDNAKCFNYGSNEPMLAIRCSLCPKSFSSSVELQQHYFTSHNEAEQSEANRKKNYRCSDCDLEFPCLSNLQGHMRIHTQGTNYKCSECSKEFALSRNLNIHMRSHSGEKPYGCPICQKRFARKENRKAHLKSHSGVKPFMCPHCGKSFSRKSHVKEHIKTHFNTSGHGNSVLSCCKVCLKTFTSVLLLKQHLEEVHNHSDDEDENLIEMSEGTMDEDSKNNSENEESDEKKSGDVEAGNLLDPHSPAVNCSEETDGDCEEEVVSKKSLLLEDTKQNIEEVVCTT